MQLPFFFKDEKSISLKKVEEEEEEEEEEEPCSISHATSETILT
jgi:hypothetical protein